MNNTMRTEFSALAENEAFARAVAAAFVMPLDPTVEELTEIKTAVCEAVSNSIIHGYACEESPENMIAMECTVFDSGKLVIAVEDKGAGIEDVTKAMEPMFSTEKGEERSGMGFTVMESFTDKLRVKSAKGEGTTVVMIKFLDTANVL